MPFSGDDSKRMLVTLQRLLEIPAANLQAALTHAANAVADALQADKVDAFLYDESRDSLVALGTSTQPLSSLQRKLGLDVLPLSNGGRVVYVYKTGKVFRTGRLLDDPEELRGVKEGMKIQSKLGVPLEIAGKLRGMVMIASLKPDFFTEADEAFARSAAHWVSLVAHRAQLIEDIERNAMQQGRQAAAEELVTVLAHDLRNYLSPITGRLHILRQRAEAERRSDDVADIQASLRAVTRLSALITNLLDVTRIDRGIFSLDMEPVDLVAFATDASAALSSGEHEIVVESMEPVLVLADPLRLRQCIDNLLANAAGHSPRGAPVNVFVSQVRTDGRTWGQLEVLDEGPGIPDEMLPRIFDRFVSGRAKEGGLGLGLYLARQIARAHGGDLTAESPPGQGARFVLRIPAYDETDMKPV